MKKLLAGFVGMFLLTSTAMAVTLHSKWSHTVKFEINLHTNGGSNDIYKWLSYNDTIDMPDLFTSYPGSTYSIVIYDYDYSRTRSECVKHQPRNDKVTITYLGGGKCKVE